MAIRKEVVETKKAPKSPFSLADAGKVLAKNPPGRKKYTENTRIRG